MRLPNKSHLFFGETMVGELTIGDAIDFTLHGEKGIYICNSSGRVGNNKVGPGTKVKSSTARRVCQLE